MTLVVGISLVFAVMLGVAALLLWRAYQRLHMLEENIASLAHDLEDANEELTALLAEVRGSRIIVDIINPMTLARSRSRWGAAFVGVAPRMVRRRVYDIVAREMKAQLAENDVEARLEIFHPSGS